MIGNGNGHGSCACMMMQEQLYELRFNGETVGRVSMDRPNAASLPCKLNRAFLLHWISSALRHHMSCRRAALN